MSYEHPWRGARIIAGIVLLAIIVILGSRMAPPEHGRTVVVRGAHPIYRPVNTLPTLPP